MAIVSSDRPSAAIKQQQTKAKRDSHGDIYSFIHLCLLKNDITQRKATRTELEEKIV